MAPRPLLPSRRAVALRARALVHSEAGFSLVEELVAVGIVVVGVALVLSAVSTASFGVRETDEHVFAENLARSQVERVQDAPYSANPTSVPYPTVSPPAGYAVSLSVEYWTAPNGPFTTTVRNDGLQQITVTVTHAGQYVLSLAHYKVNR
jgi:type II secretory pathway pseudopilin PulG